jgi:hypothetical protein
VDPTGLTSIRREPATYSNLAPGEEKGLVHVTVLFNFFEELKRRLP